MQNFTFIRIEILVFYGFASLAVLTAHDASALKLISLFLFAPCIVIAMILFDWTFRNG